VVSEALLDPALAAAHLGARLGQRPEVLLVLGSGLSQLADSVPAAVSVPFADLPGFPAATVAGHAGRFVGGSLSGRPVLVQAGRFHLYEGHGADVVCAPVRVAHALGVGTVIFTNAAGAVRELLEPGSIMVIEDHVTWGGPSVPEGDASHASGPPDLGAPYDQELTALAIRCALDLGFPLARGVYAFVPGPSYETPAEIRALARLGADAVGMSTVPEVQAARALGMSCLALSLITNLAAGVSRGPLAHEEVISVGRNAGARLGALLERVLRGLPA
jgi:purine-nucleoside phosphorylase